jgi:hypothetical protein
MSDTESLRGWLERQPSSRLAGWLELAGTLDAPLGIALAAERDHLLTGAPNPAAIREAIRRLTEPPDHPTWKNARDSGNAAWLACRLLDHAKEDGAGVAMVELAEFATQRVEQLAMVVQDSETWSDPLLAELHVIHLRACRTFNPDMDVEIGESD